MGLFRWAMTLGVALAVAGCVEALQTVKTATDLYDTARAGNSLYHASGMVKSMEDQPALFADYDRVRVEALVRPRGDGGAKVNAAFVEDLQYMVATELAEGGLDAQVCLGNCRGRVLTVQFREQGYGDNLFNRLTLGDKLRGELHFVDGANGTVVRTEKLETADTYADLAGLVHTSVVLKVGKTMQAVGKPPKAVATYLTEAKQRPAVKPELAATLKAD